AWLGRERGLDEPLPWDHLGYPEQTRFLKEEHQRALAALPSPPCTPDACEGCGICQVLPVLPDAPAAPAPAPAPPLRGPIPAPPAPLSPDDPSDRYDELAGLRDLREPVSFSLTIGYQVDGARPSGKPTLTGAAVKDGQDYSALRSWGFGEAFASSRGALSDSLSSYFALRFDAAQPQAFHGDRVAPPITTWFERDTFEVRTGWAELKDFLPKKLGLKKLRLRAGDQYVYGPWVLHIDGALLAYEGDIVTATTYAGGRHADYTSDLANEAFTVAGASLRVDLRPLAALPIAITAETLSMISGVADVADTVHRQVAVDWRPRRDVTVLGSLRTLDDKLTNEHLEVRARYQQIGSLALEVTRRFDNDWVWDPSLVQNDDATAARRYLDLGPTLPQLVASLRAGALIADNVDLTARTTVAGDLSKDGDAKSSFSASYVELAGALDVRLRRELAIGISALDRRTAREDPPLIVLDDATRTMALALPANAATGETSFTELGGRARLSLGARRFSSTVELYGRSTHYAALYLDREDRVPRSDVRGGGRVSVDAWIGKQLRLFASYEVSSALDFLPEITSYKSVRLTMTGTY
ncbi:MAG TPA: hypothetical protein VFP84_37630, partial [Kofleriaceae bacterium]|nr:hypothetical protein [Kofleriaceae bacterium]